MKIMKASKFCIILVALIGGLSAVAHDELTSVKYECSNPQKVSDLDRIQEVMVQLEARELTTPSPEGIGLAKLLLREAGFPECSIDQTAQLVFKIIHKATLAVKPIKESVERGIAITEKYEENSFWL